MIERKYFQALVEHFLSLVRSDEGFTLSLAAESSVFVRLNCARVRQAGTVEDASLQIRLLRKAASGELRESTSAFTLLGDLELDLQAGAAVVKELQRELDVLPVDPFAVWPQSQDRLEEVHAGNLPTDLAWVDEVCASAAGRDLTGILTSGRVIRATASSRGQWGWFSTESLSVDYSLLLESGRSVKGLFSASSWDRAAFERQLARDFELLGTLDLPVRKVPRGEYRVYLAPDAVSDLVGMLSWGAVGEMSIRKDGSPFRKFREQFGLTLSPVFSLEEDFSLGLSPRFNSLGEVGPPRIPVVQNGVFMNAMTSSRSAREFGVFPNGAGSSESMRSPRMKGGALAEADVFRALGTGIYLSNLNYLNWSDFPEGRITGLTRYACIWVEDGKPIAPIETLRWDETIFRIFGSELEAVTKEVRRIPATGSYESRDVGGMEVPGIILKKMCFTL